MNTEAEIRIKGMQALIGALGLVDAERFMAATSRDRFNYTEWRRLGLPNIGLQELASAMASTGLRGFSAFFGIAQCRLGD